MTPAEIYSKCLSGRHAHRIINPSGINLKQLQVTPEGRLETKTDDGWTPLNFTGGLKWYVGMGISLKGEFKDGWIQSVVEA